MKKLFWIDMEMTGLDVEKEVVIEVGAVITDYDLNTYETYSATLKQPVQYLEAMDAWNKKHHKESGLLDLIPHGKEPDLVEQDLIQLADKHFSKENPCLLAGSSIHQDRLFINKYFKAFAEKLHYRMVDVTSWKIIFQEKFNYKFQKQDRHRAVDDIRESIEELRSYLQFVKTR